MLQAEAQVNVAATVQLFYEEKNQLYVVLQISKNNEKEGVLEFNTMFSIGNNKTLKAPIKSIIITDYDNSKSEQKLNTTSTILYKFNKIKSIEYIYNCDETPAAAYQPTATLLSKDTFAYLQLNNFIPQLYFKKNACTYSVNFKNPNHLYPVSNVSAFNNNSLLNENYDVINGGLVLYSKPDSISIRDKNVTYKIFVYSDVPKKNNAKKMFNYVYPAIKSAIHEIDSVPYKEVLFIFYMSKKFNTPLNNEDKIGGLQNENTSLYFLPNYDNDEKTKKIIQQNVAHELMHMLAPQQFHSNIENKNKETLTQHLWLYEGVTEYLAQKILLKNNLITLDEFLKNMRYKIMCYKQAPPTSLTLLSKKSYKKKYKNNYDLIYNKGAIVALMLDIEIMKQTNDSLNLLSVMQNLCSKFGLEKTFNENMLVKTIENETGLALEDFFDTYVVGKKKLNLTGAFNEIGYQYYETKSNTYLTFGSFEIEAIDSTSLFVSQVSKNNLNLDNRDIIIAINKKSVLKMGINEAMQALLFPEKNENLELIIKRQNGMFLLSGSPYRKTEVLKYVLEPMKKNNIQAKKFFLFTN